MFEAHGVWWIKNKVGWQLRNISDIALDLLCINKSAMQVVKKKKTIKFIWI